MEEIWKPAVGLENYFMVSSYGRVISLGRKFVGANRFIGHMKNTGYMCVCVGRKEYFIHRMVAQAFIPNPENKKEVNHIDGNKSNNNINNLEWCTRAENAKHMYYAGLADGKNCSKHLRKPIICIETGEVFESARDCARKIGAAHQNVSFAVATGRRCRGKHFNFLKGE